ncbi:MAG TPA: ATP-binding cassette domain-containing protein, partial [Acidimicrobiales bacterium]
MPERQPTGAALAAARGLGVDLGGRRVLADVDLDVRAGELLALVGPNGAGKSTLMAALVGDVAPAVGTVEVSGRDPRS